MDSSDVNPITGVPDTQPFFIENEDITPQRKRHLPLERAEESQSQSLLAPKRRTISNSGTQRNLTTFSQSEDIQKLKDEFALPSQNSQMENEKYECVLCNHDCNKIRNQKDLRNEYYGYLISTELKLVEPCIRTYVYVEILKLIHRNKYRHMPIDEMDLKL